MQELLPSWSLAKVVAAIQALRGNAAISAVALVAEIGAFKRFADPRQLMAYLGLTPSERSCGAKTARGAIAKAGNTRARRMLVEGAWTYRLPARMGAAIPRAQHDLAAGDQRRRLEGASAALRQMPPPRAGRKANQCRLCRDRARTRRVRLGDRDQRRRRRCRVTGRKAQQEGGPSLQQRISHLRIAAGGGAAGQPST
jgi:hypothetical protein